MDFHFTAEQEKFRQEVRSFLEAELAAGRFTISSNELVGSASIEFSHKMAERGWIGMTWPRKYGGQERTYVDKMILSEEMCRVHAPIGYHFMGDRQVGPALIKFGSDWQKEYFLPRIVRAEENTSFCLLFSEPNAGSDLASIVTSAVEDGDYYVINGQKIWTTFAGSSQWGWILVKTEFDENVPRHQTCSEFILDLKTSGVTIRPIITMAGEEGFNEVFLDNVRIHKKFLVGQKNAGFKQIMAQVDYERAGIERLMQNYPVYQELLRYIKQSDMKNRNDSYYAWVRDQVAQLEVEFNAGWLLCYSTAWTIDQGKPATSQAALSKTYCTRFEQRLNELATRVIGPVSLMRKQPDWYPLEVDVAESYLWGPSYTLQGGTVEILKGIVAQRGLGLPR
ncbi:MAG: acyl-CoA dehydrogenase family protein [Syntrophobacteraceae bacterium]